MRDSDRKSAIILSLIGIVPVVWLALLIAPFVKGGLTEIVTGLMKSFEHPFKIQIIVSCFTVTAFAADGNSALSAVNNLSTFIFGLIRAIGLILTGFGVVQIGLSLKSHDPSQRANGFLTLAGGVIITFAKEILNLIIGS